MSTRPPIELVVGADDTGQRLDRFVGCRLPVSRGSILRLLHRGQVLVDGVARPKGTRLAPGQRVLVVAAAADDRPLSQPEQPLALIAELDDLVVIDKPAGIACHPLVPGETDTVANALVARFPECAEVGGPVREAGLVHRLDIGTSGALVAARTPAAYARLRRLFSAGRVGKAYLALVAGRVGAPARVDRAIEPMPGDRRRVRVVDAGSGRGQPASTYFAPVALAADGRSTLVVVGCRTGRRHQVRVHLAHAGHPLLGDELYGGPVNVPVVTSDAEPSGALPAVRIEGAFLHAASISLEGGRYDAPLPAAWRRLLGALGFDAAAAAPSCLAAALEQSS